jgi:3-hexulose-6-phosphate synthase
MRLQLALDMLSSDAALQVAKAVEQYVDIIEIGTPLIKHEGLGVVHLLRRHFSQKAILVDLKTMDVGQYEADFAFAAGADLVTVLGVADDATIAGAVASASAHGKSVVVDLINVADKAARARQAQALGAQFVGVHSGIDQQKQGHSPLIDLQAVREAVSIGVLVAGGIRLETLPEVLRLNPDIVVVGGAITGAGDPAAAAKAIREAIGR